MDTILLLWYDMVMSDYHKILEKFDGQPFRLKESQSAGIPRSVIRGWLEDETIERVAHGTYKSTSDEYDIETALIEATFIVGKPSVICLLSALEFYGLTDQIPKKTWVMVSAYKRSRQTIL